MSQSRIKFPKIIVDEYSSPIESSATPSMGIDECHRMIKEKGYRHLPVMEGTLAVGIVSERDLNLYLKLSESKSLKVRDIMRQDPYVVDYSEPLEKVVFNLSNRKIGSALVRDEGGVVSSIFTTTDAMNALIELLHGEYSEH